jgi:hypothetical protein
LSCSITLSNRSIFWSSVSCLLLGWYTKLPGSSDGPDGGKPKEGCLVCLVDC